MYPYSFNKTVNGTEYQFPDGAVIGLPKDANLPGPMDLSWFNHLVADSTLDMKLSTAIYDTSIGVLKFTDYSSGTARDLTFGGVFYCNSPLTSYIGVHPQCFTNTTIYEKYLTDNPTDHEETSVVYISPSDIANGWLRLNGVNRIGMLIIPSM